MADKVLMWIIPQDKARRLARFYGIRCQNGLFRKKAVVTSSKRPIY